jgi:hypothetical protein
MKTCEIAGCGQPKHSDHWSTKYCEDCRAAAQRKQWRDYAHGKGDERVQYAAQWRARNPDYSLRQRTTVHGITIIQYQDMLALQDHRCAICRTDDPGGHGNWHIDHDHSCCPTSKKSCGECVRGLLCSRCNTGIGLLGDDPDRLLEAARYLRDRQ